MFLCLSKFDDYTLKFFKNVSVSNFTIFNRPDFIPQK